MRGLDNIINLEAEPNFWINDIGLFVPPTSISMHKEGLDYSIKSLRTRVSTKILSGNGIYHAQVNLTFPPDSLIQLHRLISQVRNNPFVFIENAFIKSSIHGKEDYYYFTVMGLNVINHPSSVGSFNVELDLRFFNHKVYDPYLKYLNDWGYYVTSNGKRQKISFSATNGLEREGEEAVIIEDTPIGNQFLSVREIENSLGFETDVKTFASYGVVKPKDSKAYKRYCNYLQNIYLEENFDIKLENYFKTNPDLKNQLDRGNVGFHEVVKDGRVEKSLVSFRNYLIKEIFKKSTTTNFIFRNFVVMQLSPDKAKKLKAITDEGVTAGMTSFQKEAKRKANFDKLSKDFLKIENIKRENLLIQKEVDEKDQTFIREYVDDVRFRGIDLSSERDITYPNIVEDPKYRSSYNYSPSRVDTYFPLTDTPYYSNRIDGKVYEDKLIVTNLRPLEIKTTSSKIEIPQDPIDRFMGDPPRTKTITESSFVPYPIFACNGGIIKHFGENSLVIESFDKKDLYRYELPYSQEGGGFVQYFSQSILNKKVEDRVDMGDLIGFIEYGSELLFWSNNKEIISFYLNDVIEIKKTETTVIPGKKKREKLQIDENINELIEINKYIQDNYSMYTGVSGLENVLESSISIGVTDYSLEDIISISGEVTPEEARNLPTEDSKNPNSTITAVSGSLRNIVTSIPILGQEFPVHQYLGSIEPNYQINIIGKKIIGDQLPDLIEFLEQGRANTQYYAKNFSMIPDSGNFIVESLITKLLGSYKVNNVSYIKENNPRNEDAFPIIQHNFIVNSSDTYTVEGSPLATGFNFRFSESKSYREENLRPIASNSLSADYKRKVLDILEMTEVVSMKSPIPVSQSVAPIENKEVGAWSMLNWKTKYFNSHQWYSKGVPSIYKDGTLITHMNSQEPNNNMNQDYNSYLLAQILDNIQNVLNYYQSPNNANQNQKYILTFSSTFDIKGKSGRTTISNHFHGCAVDTKVVGMNVMEYAAFIELLLEKNVIKNPKLSSSGLGSLGLGIYGADGNDIANKMNLDSDSSSRKRSGFIHIDLNAVLSVDNSKNPSGVRSINQDYYFHEFKNTRRRWTGESGDDKFGDSNSQPIENTDLFWNTKIKKIKTQIKDAVDIAIRLSKGEISTPTPVEAPTFSLEEIIVSSEENKLIPPLRQIQKTRIILDIFKLDDVDNKQRYYWNQKDESATDWIPASVIKTFAAAGALLRLTELGFGANTSITFSDVNETISIKNLIEPAIIRSDNMTYNRLVQLAGHQYLHENFLNRYRSTELNSPYMKDEWKSKTNGNTTFSSPKIILNEAGKSHTILSADKRAGVIKPYTSSVTTLDDLNKLMIDLVLKQNTGISEENSALLLGALRARKASGEDFSRSIISQIKNFNFTENYGKHGFNGEWYSQSFLLLDRDQNIGFNISAVGWPGNKDVLNDIGTSIGILINSELINFREEGL